MPIVAPRYCSHCRRHVAALRNSPNHVLHAIITLLLCGLWLPVWILAAMGQTYHCPDCGRVCKTLVDKIVLGVLVGLLAILLFVAYGAMITPRR